MENGQLLKKKCFVTYQLFGYLLFKISKRTSSKFANSIVFLEWDILAIGLKLPWLFFAYFHYSVVDI